MTKFDASIIKKREAEYKILQKGKFSLLIEARIAELREILQLIPQDNYVESGHV